MKALVFTVIFSTALIGCAEKTKVSGIDEDTGLIIADGYEVVKNNCRGCHSMSIVLQNRADYETWQSTIRWMQKKQGLWKIPEEQEKRLFTYLSKNYGPGNKLHPDMPYRRKNLPAELLPR